MPLDILAIPGPIFLLIYLAFCGFTLLFAMLRLRSRESAWPLPQRLFQDPYEIAYLRGGSNEVLRLFTFALIDRGFLAVKDDKILTEKADATDTLRQAIEQAICQKFAKAAEVSSLFSDSRLRTMADSYASRLQEERLLLGKAVKDSRMPGFLLTFFLTLGLGGAKLIYALSTGHTNVLFLLIVMAATGAGLIVLHARRRTYLGDRVVDDLRMLFSGLAQRAGSLKAGGQTNDAVFLAALYGVSYLPREHFPWVSSLFAKAGTGTACGASSCGSSCGSGACGGGCGGCGGD